MKILHIIDSGGLYGAEVMLLNLMEEQRRMGLGPILASIGEHGSLEKPLEIEARRRGLHVETFPMRPGPNIAGALKVLQYARREGVDILHSHGYKGNILFGLMPRWIRRISMVTTVHGWTWTGGWSRMALYECLDRLSLRFIDRVVVVSASMKAKVGINNVYVVNNGIPIDTNVSNYSTSAIDPINALNAQIVSFCNSGYTIGAIGRLSPEKGYDILLRAIKEVSKVVPESRLVIIGEGGERTSLETQVKSLGLEGRVLMPGYVKEASQYLPLFRVLTISSLTEGLPIVILEAMRAEIPIVATDVGGIPSVLENGKVGIIVPPRSPDALAGAIIQIINDEYLSKTITGNALKRLKSLFSSCTMAKKYSEIYNGVLTSRSINYSSKQFGTIA